MKSSSGMLRRMALVRTDVSEETSASIMRVTRIGELETLAVTSKHRTLRADVSKEHIASIFKVAALMIETMFLRNVSSY
jgi:hypothetical protein